jgi:hypothetical protein
LGHEAFAADQSQTLNAKTTMNTTTIRHDDESEFEMSFAA